MVLKAFSCQLKRTKQKIKSIKGKYNHVFKCINKNDHVAKEPYFKVYAFMTVNNENKLLCYESYLHKMGFDTMNC